MGKSLKKNTIIIITCTTIFMIILIILIIYLIFHKECSNDKNCKKGEICVHNKCQKNYTTVIPYECSNSSDCKQDEICVNNKCQKNYTTVIPSGCSNDTDCTKGEICVNNKCQRSPYAPKNNGYGIPISSLAQSNNFYLGKKDDTLNYLIAVYPQGEDSLKSLNYLELASFYNSLWFYYNCSYKYDEKDLQSLTGKNDDINWDPLPCAKKYPLPYPPQGNFYNFWTYNKYNIPEIYSDSNENTEYLKLSNFGSGRPGVASRYVNNKLRPSGIMWINSRTILRNIWGPNGIYNKKSINDKKDNWNIVVGKIPTWNFPDNWYGGFTQYGDNQYVEVTHTPSNSGDALNQSPWWWYNVCIGSGLFLNLGKTSVSLNKVAAVFDLSTKLGSTVSGSKILKKFYGSSDPYDICYGIFGLCGYDKSTKQEYCDFAYTSCSSYCGPVKLGYANPANITLDNFYNEIVNYQKKLDPHSHSKTPTKDGIKASIDAARLNTNYNLAHIAVNLLADEHCFFLGINLNLDTIQLVIDPQGNDMYVFEIIDLRIPDRFKENAKKRDYSGFINIKNKKAKHSDNDAKHNKYKREIINEYLQNAYDNMWLSLRDPLDIYNNNKAKKCNGTLLSNVCNNNNNAIRMYCSQSPLMDAYKCLYLGNEFNNNSCILTGNNINC